MARVKLFKQMVLSKQATARITLNHRSVKSAVRRQTKITILHKIMQNNEKIQTLKVNSSKNVCVIDDEK